MASLFDYMSGGGDRYKDRKAPTGYSFRTTSSGKDRYTPVNELNRAIVINVHQEKLVEEDQILMPEEDFLTKELEVYQVVDNQDYLDLML